MIKPPTDWEAIEREYRAGVVSVREIARAHAVSDTAIRKRAKADLWDRDLTQKVQARVRTKLVRTTGSQAAHARTDDEIIEAAAETQAGVVRTHRRDIASGRQMVATLLGELLEGTTEREDIEEAIELKTADDTNGRRRATMLRAVALPSRAGVIKDLSAAMKNLVSLERQAFNIEGEAPDDPATKGDLRAALSSLDQTQRDQLRGIASALAGGPARPS